MIFVIDSMKMIPGEPELKEMLIFNNYINYIL